MSDDEKKNIQLHVAGATVKHINPFDNLHIPFENIEIDQPFVNKWVIPFYRNGFANADEKFKEHARAVLQEISPQIIEKLLGHFNWRTRIVGAFFSAVKDWTQFQDTIGNLLLKSEVSYAGKGYCLALAMFKTEASIAYLTRYLDYYLQQKDLYFDQAEAMSALAYLDGENQTDYLSAYLPLWQKFIDGKSFWNLERIQTNFNREILLIIELRNG
jgi:hypothetical protein